MTHPLIGASAVMGLPAPVRPRVGLFGWSRKNPDGSPKMHEGVDWLAPLGAPVIAAHEGMIGRDGWQNNSAGSQENDGYGVRLWLVGNGVRTIYGHLSTTVPYAHYMKVHEGQILGFTGNTGNAWNTEPHLHFEVHVERDGQWVPINPEWWLAIEGATEFGVPKP